MPNADQDHPVWTVYDRLRSARLSELYFCRRLQFHERLSFGMDLVLAISAPTSALAGLFLWKTAAGQEVWKWLAVVAALVAAVKPLLHLTKRIKDYEGVMSGYRILAFDYRAIKIRVEQKGEYDKTLQAEFNRALDRERNLESKNPESRENARIKRECQAEVLKELPTDKFFIPKVLQE